MAETYNPQSVATAGQVISPATPASAAETTSYGAIPIMTQGMTFREIGTSGLRQFAGWVREEFLPTLQGRQAAQKYREMMDNSPIVGAIMSSVISTMRKVQWRVTPADDSGEAQEAADFVDSCRDDLSDTWEDTIIEDLSMLGYGFAPKEIVYKRRLGQNPGAEDGRSRPRSLYDDGKIGWRKLRICGQDTVIKWFFDDSGGIKGLTQQPWTGIMVDLPIEKLLLFRPTQHKGNPEGKSILRSAFVPYYFIKRMQEQEAILGERLGGLPIVKVPSMLIQAAAAGDPDATAAIQAYKNMAMNVRIDEQMGLMLPSDPWMGPNGPTGDPQYDFKLVTPEGGGRGSALNFDVSITRYNTQILTSVLSDFLVMGHDTRGAQNLGETKLDMFFQAIEGFLNSNAAVYNRHALPRLWRLNGFDPAAMPKIEPDLAQRTDLDVLSMFVLRMSQAGMPLFPNDEIQSYLLDVSGLPDVTDDRALQAAGLLDDQLDMEDDKSMAALDRMQAPPQPAPGSPKDNLQKMIMGSLARRMVRMGGPKYGISTKRSRATSSGHRHSHVAKRSPSDVLAASEAVLAKAIAESSHVAQ